MTDATRKIDDAMASAISDAFRDATYRECVHCWLDYSNHVRPALKCPFEASVYRESTMGQRLFRKVQ